MQIDDLDELTNGTIALMRTFAGALEDHVYLKDYKSVEARLVAILAPRVSGA